MGIKDSRFPFWRRDLGHADVAAELVRQLSERAFAFLQAVIATLFGRALVNTDAALAHCMHHRQQIDVPPIGVARPFPIEDRVQVFDYLQRGDRICLGVGSNEVGW